MYKSQCFEEHLDASRFYSCIPTMKRLSTLLVNFPNEKKVHPLLLPGPFFKEVGKMFATSQTETQIRHQVSYNTLSHVSSLPSGTALLLTPSATCREKQKTNSKRTVSANSSKQRAKHTFLKIQRVSCIYNDSELRKPGIVNLCVMLSGMKISGSSLKYTVFNRFPNIYFSLAS